MENNDFEQDGLTRADSFFQAGIVAASREDFFVALSADAFEFHADFQNYLAGIRSAVI